ncbi:MAG: glycosyltransferase family 9 protein [Chromatiales bacterium]|nr:glycosyltransferase family 9 protein [Chromatiales bacterium]
MTMARRLVKVALSAAEWPLRVVHPTVPGSVDGGASAPRRILVWTMDRLGDVVRATGALEALRERHPEAEITVVAAGRAAPVLEAHPAVDALEVVADCHRPRDHLRVLRRLRRQRFDLAVLMEADPGWTRLGAWWTRALRVGARVCFDFGDGVPAGFRGVVLGGHGSWVDEFAALVEAPAAGAARRRTRIVLTASERARAETILAEHGLGGGARFAVVHPGSNFLTVARQWPVERFAELVRWLTDRHRLPVVLTGVSAEQGIVNEVLRGAGGGNVHDLCGRLGVRELAAVAERATLCVVNDTGPLHVFQALDRPTVAILGATAPEVVGIAPRTAVARKALPCSPCAFHQGWRECSNARRWECMQALDVDAVRAVVETVLAAAPPAPGDDALAPAWPARPAEAQSR